MFRDGIGTQKNTDKAGEHFKRAFTSFSPLVAENKIEVCPVIKIKYFFQTYITKARIRNGTRFCYVRKSKGRYKA
jgi:hypothetical protein